MLRVLLSVVLLAWTCQSLQAQQLDWEVNANGFFDNSEGQQTYRLSDTYGGFRLEPQLSLTTTDDRHRLVAGYDAFTVFGAKPQLDADGFLAYYRYHSERFQVLLGKYPRTLQQEVMPDYLLCDSFQYYRPYMTGFDFQYVCPSGYFEAFLDWTAKRSETVREQFMAGILTRFSIGGCWQLGLNGYYYHYANERFGKYMGHRPHDNFLAHPYIGVSRQQTGVLDSLYVRVGVLVNLDRDRATDKKWHVPVGFLGEVDACWRRFSLSQLVYMGRRQQYYGQEGFGLYYWGDAYYRSPYYSRTDVSYQIWKDRYVSFLFGMAFHVTDKGLHFNQMLTLKASLGSKNLKDSKQK